MGSGIVEEVLEWSSSCVEWCGVCVVWVVEMEARAEGIGGE